jgi:peptidoglycan/LPS O-acetylase OafA/YrhL
MLEKTKSDRFDVLDGLRGVAAVAVMVYHYTLSNQLYWLGGAWVAVDLFFILSGFVIAHSYGGKILAGMGLRQFFLIRLVRLGPLYWLGLLLGFVSALLLLLQPDAPPFSTGQAVTALGLGLAWLPYFNGIQWPMGAGATGGPNFPLNDPAWSLFFEFVVNLAFFWFVAHYRKYPNGWIVLAAIALFLVPGLASGMVNPGWGSQNFLPGFPRVFAGFLLGSWIYSRGLHRKHYPLALSLAVGLLALLLLKSSRFAMLNSITLVPLTVVLLSTVRVQGMLRSACKVLGDISYPVYILHVPLYRFLYETTALRSLHVVRQTLLVSAICIVLSLLLAVLDLGLRKSLMARLAKGLAPAAAL